MAFTVGLMLRTADIGINNEFIIMSLLLMRVSVLATTQNGSTGKESEMSNFISDRSDMMGAQSLYDLSPYKSRTTNWEAYATILSFKTDSTLYAQRDTSTHLTRVGFINSSASFLKGQSIFQGYLPLTSSTLISSVVSDDSKRTYEPPVTSTETDNYGLHYVSSSIGLYAQEPIESVSQNSAQKTTILNTIPARIVESVPASISSNLYSSLAPSFITASDFQTVETAQSDFNVTTYISADNSKYELGALTSYFPLTLSSLKNMILHATITTPEHSFIFSHQIDIDQQIGPASTNTLHSRVEYSPSSQSTDDSLLNSTLCCQPKEISSNDEKEWAIPVTICLVILLVVTWAILFVVCRRSRPEIIDSIHGQVHEEYDTAHSQHVVQQSHTESPTPFSYPTPSPRQGKQTIPKFGKHHGLHLNENFHHADSELYLRNPNTNSKVISSIGSRELSKLCDQSPNEKQRKASHRKDNRQYNNQELKFENETQNYDNYSFVPNSLESNNGHLEVHSTHWPDYRTSESKCGLSYSADYNDHMLPRAQMKHNKTDERVSNKIIVNTKNGYFSDAKRSNSETNDSYGDTEGNNTMELTRFTSRDLKNCHSRDNVHTQNGWKDDRKPLQNINQDEMHKILRGNGNYSNSQTSDPDSVDSGSHAAAGSIRKRPDEKLGMSKSISFDETRTKAIQDKFSAFNKKRSPTRKISTNSESSLSSLALPQSGILNTSSVYDTMDNLTKIERHSVESRFYNDSYSDKILDIGVRRSGDYLETPAKDNRNERNGQNDRRFFTGNTTKMISEHNKEDSETQCTKPTDDYIFPIVRKANIKIMEKRQQRNVINKSNKDYDEHGKSFTNMNSSDGGSKLALVNTKNADPDGFQDTKFPPSSIVLDEVTIVPTRRISQPSKLPTIILTRDDSDVTDVVEHMDVRPESPSTRPPRVRRIARANNPFLIEVQSPTEKVRRSSAPSMTRSSQPPKNAVKRDRMTRSASGDHLCLNSHNDHFDRHDLYTARSWSSELFALISNAQSEDSFDKEYVKKMIDDRYNALFNHKYSHLMTPSRFDNKSFMQDISPRISQIISNSRHKTLSQEGGQRSEHGSFAENTDTETMSRFSPVKEDEKPDSETGQNIKFSISSPRGNRSPRPSLAPGTDGIDSDSDHKKADFLTNWQRNVEPKENKFHPYTAYERYGNNHDKNKRLPLSETQWESFEDDYEKRRFIATSVSERTQTLERGKGPSLLPIISERPSVDKVMGDWTEFKNKSPGRVKQRHRNSPPNKASSEETQDEDIIDKHSDAFPDVTASGKLVSEKTSTLISETTSSPVLSVPIPGTFDDNFDINTIESVSAANYIESNKQSDDQPAEEDDNKLSFGMNNKTLAKAKVVPPVKPQRRARKKIIKQDIFQRPPPPFSLNVKGQLQFTDGDKEGSSSDDHFISTSVLPSDLYNVEPSVQSPESETILRKHGQLKSRSLSLEIPDKIKRRFQHRSMTLETDKLTTYLNFVNDWSKLFGGNESKFLSSANNTLLVHSSSEDVSGRNTTISEHEIKIHFAPTHETTTSRDGQTTDYPSMPPKQGTESVLSLQSTFVTETTSSLIFESTHSPEHGAKDQKATSKDQKTAKQLIPEENYEEIEQVTSV